MSGLTACVLLRRPFTPADTGRVTQLLRELVDDVSETRHGRHWEFTSQNTAGLLSVLDTSEHADDFEEQLVANDLLFDDAPDAIVLSFGTQRDCDREICATIAARLTESHRSWRPG